MNAMTIPGFTAEASVSDTAGRYRMPAILRRDASQLNIVPQWRCERHCSSSGGACYWDCDEPIR